MENEGNSVKKPQLGMTFNSEVEAYDFYNKYGGAMGFGVRRSSVHRSKDDNTIITWRKFVCSKEGTRGKDKRDADVTKRRAETRTNCLAKMCICRLADGMYECKIFVEEHNHELHTPATSHLMRSQRAISKIGSIAINMADGSGIKPKKTFDNLGLQAGERENLGFTREDLKNYLQTKRQVNLDVGEVDSLNEYFQSQCRLNPSFTFSTQLDNAGQITNIFWADPKMLVDYACFGDVVSFNTTFCTNKECRPLGIFAGFNHHKGAVIFGAALLYDVTTESFIWLFKRFLEANGQKKPVTIFTDQDPAIAKAIIEVLPDTWHGLCTWHLLKNGIMHHGNMMREGSSFLRDLKKCVYEYVDDCEFEAAWRKFREDHPVSNPWWLDKIYQIKEKWARCYMKNTFTLGIRNTQLSESINADLKAYLSCNLNVKRFFQHFERVVESKRENELKAEFETRNELPVKIGYKTPMLNQAGKVYTPAAYLMFVEEFVQVGCCRIVSHEENEVGNQYGVGVLDEEGQSQQGVFTVLYTPAEDGIDCSCRKFQTHGILCCHALKICEIRDIKYIPLQYILRRWTRAARHILVKDNHGKEIFEDIRLDRTRRFSFIVRKYIQVLIEACDSLQGFDLVVNNIEMLSNQVRSIHSDECPMEASVRCREINTGTVLKKKDCRKGQCKRPSGWVDNIKKKKSNQPKPQGEVELSQLPLMSTAPNEFEDCTQIGSFMSLLTVAPSSQASTSTPCMSTSVYNLGTSQASGSAPELYHDFMQCRLIHAAQCINTQWNAAAKNCKQAALQALGD